MHTVTRKPAPTAEEEADFCFHVTELKRADATITVRLCSQADATHAFQSAYKLFLGLYLTIIFVFDKSADYFLDQSIVWSIECQQAKK